MKNGNSEERLDHDTFPPSLHTIEHCSLVKSQYFHADAAKEALQSLAMVSITSREGLLRASRARTTAVGINSSAAKSSASRSRLFAVRFHLSMSPVSQIDPYSSWPGSK